MPAPAINLIALDIPADDLTAIEAALTVLETKLLPHCSSLTMEQRSNLTKMGQREQLVRDSIIAAQQNPAFLPASVEVANAEIDIASLDKHRPLFARVQKLHEACDDTEMSIGIDLINFALRIYEQLKISAPASLKGLLDTLGQNFPRGRRVAALVTPSH